MSNGASSDPSTIHSSEAWRERLACRGRPKFVPADFSSDERLYRGFKIDELDEAGVVDANTLRLPDLSCNWSRFSEPEDIRHRMAGCEKDGCYSLSVENARYDEFATACHSPICGEMIENYSHVELREIYDDETIHTEPPQGREKRKNRTAKAMRLAWRTHIVNNITVEFNPEQ